MIYSVILAGGLGTRLWPLSDTKMPKQFLKLFSDNSMLVETSNRILPVIPIENQYILTGKRYVDLVEKQFDNKVSVLVEPFAKNTAPCILWAALKIKQEYNDEAIMLVMPSDHLIKNENAFLDVLRLAFDYAKGGEIVTFGIVPTCAETGYGYIEIEDSDFEVNKKVKKLCAFHEKPDFKKAQKYIDAGNYMWNSGMFVFNVKTIIEEFQKYCPQVYKCFKDVDLDNIEQIKNAFSKSKSISIDYAIMEYTKKACCIPSDFGWSDVGSYKSLHNEHEKDADGNVCVGNVTLKGTKNCYINSRKKNIVCIDVDDLVIVENKGTILIAKKDSSDEIGEIAKKIKRQEDENDISNDVNPRI